MSDSLPVVCFGLGPIGQAAARLVLARPGLELVGAVDADPAKAGRDLGDLLGLDRELDLAIATELAELSGRGKVAVHATGSSLDRVAPQLEALLESGLDVVSSCEELSYPWRHHGETARRLDEVAQNLGRTVLGTGVNPGFLMDALPLFLTGLSQGVEHVGITRIIDASLRRGPFQTKIGAGRAVEDFRAEAEAGRLGHVGLPESLAMVCDSLGWTLDREESRIEPVVAAEPVVTDHVQVPADGVKGLEQEIRGFVGDREVARLRFLAALDIGEDGDTVRITGKPSLTVHLHGTHGDLATVAVLVNALPHVHAAPAGLLTMRDLPPLWGRRG